MGESQDRRRTMPSKKTIAQSKNIDADVCQGCGMVATTERAHIHAFYKGGTNNVKNILLLCPFCHRHIQEYFSDDINDSIFITELFKKEHMPFFKVKANFFINKINSGLIPKKLRLMLLSKFTEKQLDKIKKFSF